MGWGAKKVAPLRPKLQGDEPIDDQAERRLLLDPEKSQNCAECGMPQFNTPSGMTCANGHGGADQAELVDASNQAHKDRMDNGPLMARWAPETATRFVMEFIAERQLFGELNAYLKRKIR